MQPSPPELPDSPYRLRLPLPNSAAPEPLVLAPTPMQEKRKRRIFIGLFVALVMSQTFMGFMGAGDRFVLGHNGWNSSAYLQSARNTLRWGTLFPVQYYTGRTPPTVHDGYTHHPLGMHLHNTLAVWLFGDHEGSIRAVPAFFGVLALIALMMVVRLLYDDRTALFAGLVFVLLPTNAIFTNMSNHENGFIFWTCLWGYAYVRFLRARYPAPTADAPTPTRTPWLRWYGLMLFAFVWAAMWDWPAYYCALIFAVHWLAVLLKRLRAARAGDAADATTASGSTMSLVAGLRALLPDIGLLAGFSLLVLGLFVGHFLLVAMVVGSLSELHGVFEARQQVGRAMILNHLKVVPLLMFTAPVLLVSFGWLGHRGWQAFKGRLARRDLIALTFGIAGLLHYYIFRGTAVIHEFWGWTLVPFTSIACAYVLSTSIDRLRAYLAGRWQWNRRLVLALAVALPTLAIVGNLAYRFVDLVPRGRAVGGSLWFVENTRPILEDYISTREMIRFADQVKAETTRRVGVLLDPAFERIRGFEPRFAITLDREVVTQTLRKPPPDALGVTEGWVYIAPPSVMSDRRIIELALVHPVLIYDGYVMVDLRRQETEVRVWKSEPCERDFWTWYWGGPWADAVLPVPQPAEEARLVKAISDFRSAHPR